MPKVGDKVIGACGECGGAVVVPLVYMSVRLPVPTCEDCGAHAAPRHGPPMKMIPDSKRKE